MRNGRVCPIPGDVFERNFKRTLEWVVVQFENP